MWARVRSNKVTMIVSSLPKMFQGVENFDQLTSTQLRAYGWFPFRQVIPAFNRVTHYVKSMGYTITVDEVIEIFDVFIKLVVTHPHRSVISSTAFRQRFTQTELIDIETARLSHASLNVRARLGVWLDEIKSQSTIDLTNTRVIDGVNAMVTLGIFTQSRADEILQIE
jgi:hypothetical protein